MPYKRERERKVEKGREREIKRDSTRCPLFARFARV
jgi:hypothetical protein